MPHVRGPAALRLGVASGGGGRGGVAGIGGGGGGLAVGVGAVGVRAVRPLRARGVVRVVRVLRQKRTVVDLLPPGRPLEGDLVGTEAALGGSPRLRVRRGEGRAVHDLGVVFRVVRVGDARRGHGQGERPPRQGRDHRPLVGRQLVLHATVPGRDGDGDQGHVVDDDGPARPRPVLPEYESVPVGERWEPERAACLRVVVPEHTGELRRGQQHRRQYVQRVVPGGDRVVRPGHASLP